MPIVIVLFCRWLFLQDKAEGKQSLRCVYSTSLTLQDTLVHSSTAGFPIDVRATFDALQHPEVK